MQNRPSKAEILVVDDDPCVQNMMRRILVRSAYTVRIAAGGQDALKKMSAKIPDLIILDLSMPGIDGFEVAADLKGKPETRDIPLLMITGLDTSKNHVKALDLDVNDFLSKTAEPEEILARIRSHLKIKQLNDELNDYKESLKKMVALRTGQLKEASLEVIWRLTAASEYRDNETGAHIKRMSHYSAAIAKKMGLAKKAIETILYSAPMHDIGKIGVPDRILLKPDKLNAVEWEIMKKHTLMGANILKGSKIGFVRMGAIIALTHHEKWDGSGYPQGLEKKQIPLAGRIVALADVFDALTSERPYKKAFPIEAANHIIAQGSGQHFDPDVVAAFFAIQDEILHIREIHQEENQNTMFCFDRMLNEGSFSAIADCIAV
jgi:putative two-component system response regulator